MEILASNLITPAIIISVAVFLVRFYGKVISDQKPFTDDRNWEIELAGIGFFVNMLIPVVSGIFGALNFTWFTPSHLFRASFIVISSAWLLIMIYALTEKIYGIKIPFIQDLIKSAKDNQIEFKEPSPILKLIHYSAITYLLPFLYAYILILEYQSNNVEWLISTAAIVFINFNLIALFYSLNRTRLPQVNLIFINNKRSIFDVTLLKVNKDNIRIKQGEKVSIVSKDQVERIEFLPLKESGKE
ncbi:MAG: hypothetical protein WC926_01815 [Candidatus Paceibacterota bacterium]|jgi:hypothetical protein